MKHHFLTLILICLSISCHDIEPVKLDVPWFISERIKTGQIENYNFVDSLNKYQAFANVKIVNQSKYDSFIIDLEYKIGEKPKNELKKEVEKLAQKNQREFCEEIIRPALNYITPVDRPYRRYSRPYITELDFDYFLDQCIQCDYINDSLHLNYEIGKLALSNIMLKDQWFRIPHREMDSAIQEQYDIENKANLDELYNAKKLNLQDKDVRSNIYILLLHSTHCEWTKKWLKIYFENCNNYPKYSDNLNHFLYRSTCQSDEIIEMVKNEIEDHKIKS